MEQIYKAFGKVLLLAAIFFIAALLGALSGAFSGWVLSISPLMPFVASGAAVVGLKITPEILPGVGAFLGFVGTYFRVTSSHDKD